MKIRGTHSLFFILLCFCAGCANVMAPTGGKKDTTPPKLVSIDPRDSLLNTRVKKIVLHFDEYITVNDVAKEVQISPILSIQPTVTGKNKEVTVKIADTLLEENTTYRISFGKAIRDLHEGNPYPDHTYTFSTGSFFDSLQFSGKVIDASTGLPDTGAVYVVLYSIKRPDSAIVREKPKYIAKAGADGVFALKGLPAKPFRVYAIKDVNANMIYDGSDEMVAFAEKPVTPGDTSQPQLLLRMFREIDTSRKKDDTSGQGIKRAAFVDKSAKEGFTYQVSVDTTDIHKRSFDITKPIEVLFNKKIGSIQKGKITLTYDSAAQNIPAVIVDSIDTSGKKLLLRADWRENTVYTLRLPKGFAKDTGNAEAIPSKYVFRTKRDDDYGKIQVHLPSKYYDRKFILMLSLGADTIYFKPVSDTMVNLVRLKPGSYTMRIIIDENRNGKWDPGQLFNKVQPEEVVPYIGSINLKAGWENQVDFEPKPEPKVQAPPKSKPKAANSKPK